MEGYDKGPVISCFAHISNLFDDVFNNAIKVILLFGTLGFASLGRPKADSILGRSEPEGMRTEAQARVDCPEPGSC